jgi:hypothetical protein
MNEVLLILSLCQGVDVFDISREEMTYIAGVPALGLYLHGSIFIRNDLEPVIRQGVYVHECVHYKQEKEKGVAKDGREWHRRECEAERIQQMFLGAHGKGVVGVCNYGSQ